MQQYSVELNNGVAMPTIGFGTWRLDNSQQSIEIIAQALKAGYRMIDTATLYQNEVAVGKAIRESDLDRQQLFVITKLHTDDQGYQSTLDAYQTSLDQLGLDYADLYLIHSPTADTERYVSSWQAMENLYRHKQVRAIGVSNFWPAQLEVLSRRCTVRPTVNQIHLHPYLQQQQIRDYCQRQQIAIQSYSPLARASELLEDEILLAIASKHQKTVAQIILRWHLQNKLVPIPKSSHSNRQQENLAIFDFQLDDDDLRQIAGLDRQPK